MCCSDAVKDHNRMFVVLRTTRNDPEKQWRATTNQIPIKIYLVKQGFMDSQLKFPLKSVTQTFLRKSHDSDMEYGRLTCGTVKLLK